MSETRLSHDAHGLKSMLKYFHRDSVSCYPYVFLTSNWDVCTAVIVSYIQVLFFGNVSQQKKMTAHQEIIGRVHFAFALVIFLNGFDSLCWGLVMA